MSRIDDLIAEHCPDGIPFEPLQDVGVWYGGGTPSKQRSEYWLDGTIPWLSPKDMHGPIVSETEDRITPAAVSGSATKLVPANSVALVVRSSILDRRLPVALIPVEITLNQDMRAVRPRPGIEPSYLAHLLQSLGDQLLRVARKTGGSVASIDVPKLMKYRVPIPPNEIQQQLAQVLDRMIELEAKLRAELRAELGARSRQYAYYRDRLLTFTERERERERERESGGHR